MSALYIFPHSGTVIGSEVEERVFAVVKERLPLTASQPPDDDASPSLQPARHHPGVDPSPATFGVVRRVEEHYHFPSSRSGIIRDVQTLQLAYNYACLLWVLV